MSAMGSLVINLLILAGPARSVPCSSPTGLDHSGDLAIQGELAEAQAANAELAQVSARPAAAPTAVAVLAVEPGGLSLYGLLQLSILGDFRGCSHRSSSFRLLPERHPHVAQQSQPFGVGRGRGGD